MRGMIFITEKKNRSCCTSKAPKFYQTKGYLIGITLFAAFSIAYPYYSTFFTSQTVTTKNSAIQNLKTVTLGISGMTCTACETTINNSILKVNGVVSAKTSYKNENVKIEFDSLQTTYSELKTAIFKSGYNIKQE